MIVRRARCRCSTRSECGCSALYRPHQSRRRIEAIAQRAVDAAMARLAIEVTQAIEVRASAAAASAAALSQRERLP